MLFHSPEFLLLLLATLVVYILLPRWRLYVLAAANVVFYAAAGLGYLALFLVMATLTYACSLGVRGPRGRWLLWAGVGANLANLVYFKYMGFFAANAERFLHLGLDPAVWRLVLPVGISFYTFQLVAYLVDVHHGRIAPARDLIRFWVFIAFFGQLIAGPIMRGADFLPQVESAAPRPVRYERFRYGVFLFLIGLVKKVMLADVLSGRVDTLFAGAAGLGGIEAWVAALLFGFQIYYDFSAYSDMALGIGHLFGYELTTNFHTPYLAQNPAEFWRRWHITLSTWIRDYIYIPLGGSRQGTVRTYVNLVAAMVISGLWHGAAWTFVVWGLIHGLLAAGHKLYVTLVAPWLGLRLPDVIGRWAAVLLMYGATTVAWVFFRADSFSVAGQMVYRMLTFTDLHFTWRNAADLTLVAALFLLHVGEFWLRHRQHSLYAWWSGRFPAPVRALAYSLVVVAVLLAARTENAAFIYFRF